MTTISARQYSRGKHPNSLLNLNDREGRPLNFEQKKKNRTVSVTDLGWEGLDKLAKEQGCKGISDLFDRLGRGEFLLVDANKMLNGRNL